MFNKSFTLFAAGIMMAGMLAGTAAGSIDAMAAEKISEAEAKEIAAEDAEAEYDYDVAKTGGKILNASRKVKVPACVAAEEKANAGTARTGRQAAIDAALDHAGFDADEVSGLRCEKDYDDGREIYDVEFRHGGYEYNYDIDAQSNRIIEWDKDYDD